MGADLAICIALLDKNMNPLVNKAAAVAVQVHLVEFLSGCSQAGTLLLFVQFCTLGEDEIKAFLKKACESHFDLLLDALCYQGPGQSKRTIHQAMSSWNKSVKPARADDAGIQSAATHGEPERQTD